jgi:hypothetical protein
LNLSHRSDKNDARERLRRALAKTAGRERELGRDGFHQLAERVQSQLAVLQGQAVPKEDTLEAMLAAEHILKTYNKQLDDAFNLVAQLAGEAGRQAARQHRRINARLITFGVLAIAASGGLLFYRRAVAAKASDCGQAAGCRELGLCGAALRLSAPVGINCQPGSDEDCAQSTSCRDSGRCKSVAGQCAAASDADCTDTPRCKDGGLCSAREGDCVAAKVQDCRTTKDCTSKGRCTPIGNVCKVGSDADCRQSDICKTHGACSEVEHNCVKLDGFDGPDGGTKTPAAQTPGAEDKRK